MSSRAERRGLCKALAILTAPALFACSGELPVFERLAVGGGQPSAGTSPGGQGTAGQSGGQSSGGLGNGGQGSGGDGGPTGGGSPNDTGYLLIDDFEDGDSRASNGLGWWYPVNDGSGTQGWGIEPVTSAAAGGVYALRSHGQGFSDWGAIQGLNLLGNEDVQKLDASASSALTFWARAASGSSTALSAQVVDVRGERFYFDLGISEGWAKYRAPFAEMQSATDAQLSTAELIVVQFLFSPHEPFDVWLDDVAFEP